MRKSMSLAASAAAVLALVVLFGSGCQKKIEVELTPKFTRAAHVVDAKDANILSAENYQKITDGMTQDEVRAVFGTAQPVVTGYKATEEYELVWEHEGKEITVRFRGDKSAGKSQKGVTSDAT